MNNVSFLSAEVLSKEGCLVVISEPSKPPLRRGNKSRWAKKHQNLAVDDWTNVLLLMNQQSGGKDRKENVGGVLDICTELTPPWPRRSTTTLFTDSSDTSGLILVEKATYCSRIMSPNTPQSFARTMWRPKKTEESWLQHAASPKTLHVIYMCILFFAVLSFTHISICTFKFGGRREGGGLEERLCQVVGPYACTLSHVF